MAKALLYRLFGVGKIPEKIKKPLETEVIDLAEEGISGSFTAWNFKAPGKSFTYKKEFIVGWLAIPQKRVLSYTLGKRQINIMLDDPKLSKLFVQNPKPGILIISFNAKVYHDDWSGKLELKYKTVQAEDFFEKLLSLGCSEGKAV